MKRYRLGRDPILVEPSHSWMQKADIVLPSTDFIRQILQPIIEKLLSSTPIDQKSCTKIQKNLVILSSVHDKVEQAVKE